MATFEAQVEALTGLTIDGSSSPTQTELTQFLTDGAKEILSALPRSKQELYTTSNDLDSSSSSYTVLGSEVFAVTRDDGTINQPCRRVPTELQGRVRDSDDMMAASATDPVYYITNNILVVVPSPTNSNNAHVQVLAYPAVAYGDSAIAKFPDEAEYLVPLYASIKSLQNKMASMSDEIPRNSDQDGTHGNAATASQGYEKVRNYIEVEEDTELSSATIASLSSEMQQFVAEYQWYQGQQAKLEADYDKGLQILRT